MLKFISKLLILLFFLSLPAISAEFKSVSIVGNKRIANETIKVFASIPSKKTLNENDLNIILKNLYETGFFSDVSININNKILLINVIENPIIQTLIIDGVKAKKIEKSILDNIKLKDRSSFNLSDTKSDEITIINSLKELGYYFATVVSSIEELSDNKINLTYTIDIGKKARISKISFVGKKKFKDNVLRSIIVTEEYKFWKIISGKKFLNESLVQLDKRLLTNFYKNKGFFDIKIDSSFANFLGNNEFELIFNINSGRKYFFNELTLELPTNSNRDNFLNLENIFTELKGENYSLNSINKILESIDKIVLDEQYEFLTSTVSENINDNLIDLIFKIEETESFYIEKINIFGNNITLEEVVRNNLLIDEGDPFNEILNTRSINNIKSLNFFKDVKSEVIIGSTENQKIININVQEKPTGEITAGAGVGTNGGTIGFGLKENNFLGRGIAFISDLEISNSTLRGIISLENPNYQGTNRSLSTTLESTVTDRLKNFGYKSNKTGFSIGSGFEFYDDLFLTTGVSVYTETIKTDSTASATLLKQKGSYFDTYFNYSFDYDKRNQKYQPSAGFRSKFNQNLPIISESYTVKNFYNFSQYNEWSNENISSLGFYLGNSMSLNGKDIKLSDRLFLPSNKLRGFEGGKIGPKDGDDFVGGNYAFAINAATTIPQLLPNSENFDFSIFFDAGNVWGVDYDSSISDKNKIRSSIGMAIDVRTPIGPLSFSLAETITKADTDITETFRFNLGTSF